MLMCSYITDLHMGVTQTMRDRFSFSCQSEISIMFSVFWGKGAYGQLSLLNTYFLGASSVIGSRFNLFEPTR